MPYPVGGGVITFASYQLHAPLLYTIKYIFIDHYFIIDQFGVDHFLRLQGEVRWHSDDIAQELNAIYNVIFNIFFQMVYGVC